MPDRVDRWERPRFVLVLFPLVALFAGLWLLGGSASAGKPIANVPADTPTATITTTPTSTPTPPPCIVINDSITASDPTQVGMLTRTFIPSNCDFSPACPGVADTLPRHYKAYAFYFPFSSFSSQCITVNLTATGCPGNLYSVGYRFSFDPSNICSGYQGDTGDVVSGTTTYVFRAFRGNYFYVVVHEVTPNTGCSSFTLTLTGQYGCSYIVTNTPTVTSTSTPTPTYTPTHAPTNTPTYTDTPTSTPTNAPCVTLTPLVEGFEGGNLGAFATSGSPGWSVVTTDKHTGVYSAFAPNVNFVSDQRLALSSPVSIPSNASSAELSFWHQHVFDSDGILFYDGGLLEVSTDGGTSWVDAGANITSGGYNCTIATGHFNPLAGRQGWGGYSANYPSFNRVIVNLLPYAGQSLLFRFRLGTDHVVAAVGWWIDDVQVTIGGAACPTPTPTPAPLLLVAHVTWQGIPQPDHRNTTETLNLLLRPSTGGYIVQYANMTTDASGYFTVPVSALAPGDYDYWVKGPRNLANGGQVTLTGGPVSNAEMGLMAAGDADNSNVVGATDFTILRNTFGHPWCYDFGCGFDPRADFDNNDVVNATDFVLLKNNYAHQGAPPFSP